MLYLAGDIAAVIIHSVGHGEINKVQLWTLLLPIAIGAVAEVLTTVSGKNIIVCVCVVVIIISVSQCWSLSMLSPLRV